MRALRGPGIQTQLLMGPIVNRRRVGGDVIDVDKGEALGCTIAKEERIRVSHRRNGQAS